MTLRFAFAVALLVALAGCSNVRAARFNGTPLGGIAAPNFTLTDQHDRAWQLAEQSGKTVVLFFGYTHCTDTCPVTLGKLAAARAALGAQRKNAEIIFITIDPARDTPAVMASYLAQRYPQTPIVGLTGSRAQIARVERAYHIWAAKLPGHNGNYNEAHSSEIYVIGPHARERVLDDAGDSVAILTSDLKGVVQ